MSLSLFQPRKPLIAARARILLACLSVSTAHHKTYRWDSLAIFYLVDKSEITEQATSWIPSFLTP